MIRMTTTGLLLALTTLGAPALAQGVFISPPPGFDDERAPLTGKQRFIAQDLARIGLGGVDVGRLSDRQLAHIGNILNSESSVNAQSLRIRGVLNGTSIVQQALDNQGK